MRPSTNTLATAHEVKRALLKHLIGYKGHVVALEEHAMGEGICDVLAITRAGFAHDFEVKVERQDLRSELTVATMVLDETDKNLTPLERRAYPKLWKHQCMQLRLKCSPSFPSMFSFVVPVEMQELAQPIAERAGYGLVTFVRYEDEFGEARAPWYQFRFVLPARKMHTQKFDRWANIARSICFKHYFGRQEEET